MSASTSFARRVIPTWVVPASTLSCASGKSSKGSTLPGDLGAVDVVEMLDDVAGPMNPLA
ncbi:MAG: hypothetical protein M5T61_16340 [Acidimicrobiia bacterium]|nr:hypothetical protein [Acidimicrobiia bacterium]